MAISINLRNVYESVGTLLRNVFFTVSSIVTTTGYATVDFKHWPLFSRLILLLLMFVGSMAGSTAGGLKVSRVAIYCKTFIREIRRSINPNRVLPLRFEGKQLSKPILQQISNYLILYASLFTALTLVVAVDLNDFESAFSAVAVKLLKKHSTPSPLISPSTRTGSVTSKRNLSFGPLTWWPMRSMV